MLCHNKSPEPFNLFQLPYGPMSAWNEITVMYPDIITEMDGSSPDSFLSFFYELNPIDRNYIFKDDDSEADFAEAIGLSIHVVSTGDDRDRDEERLLLLKNFFEREIEEDTVVPEKQTKADKKERRLKLVQSRLDSKTN